MYRLTSHLDGVVQVVVNSEDKRPKQLRHLVINKHHYLRDQSSFWYQEVQIFKSWFNDNINH